MTGRDDAIWNRQSIDATASRRRSLRPRRPTSAWGWLLWLFAVVLFYLLISYVLVHWWYRPVPTDAPVTPPNSNIRST
jgi:hypothetical protein